jgi:hypothetical protein
MYDKFGNYDKVKFKREMESAAICMIVAITFICVCQIIINS